MKKNILYLLVSLFSFGFSYSKADNNPVSKPIKKSLADIEISILGDTVICEGETTTLYVPEGYSSYEWSDGSDDISIRVNTDGIYSVTVTDDEGNTGTASVHVTVNPLPEPFIIGSTLFCEGSSSTLTVDGVYPHYQWSTGSDSIKTIVTQAGTYGVTVTDDSGCKGLATVNVMMFPAPDFTITGDTLICAGNSSTLTVTPAQFKYHWSTGDTTQSITTFNPGVFSVTITNQAQCSSTQSVTVSFIKATPDISGDTLSCDGSPLALDAGDGYESYQWSDGSTGRTFLALSSGSYCVTVTDQCGSTGSSCVDVIIQLPFTVDIKGDTAICKNNESILYTSETYVAYEWSTGSDFQFIAVDESGTYYVTVTDDFGCTGTDSFDLVVHPRPEFEILGQQIFCHNDSTTLTISQAYEKYHWSTGDSTQSVRIATEGQIYVTVTNEFGCSEIDSILISETKDQHPVISGDILICGNDSTILSLDQTYNYMEWSNGSHDQSITVNINGNYCVTVADICGSSGDTCVDVKFNYTFKNPILYGDTVKCREATVVFGVEQTFANYIWSNDSATATITIDTAGEYCVTVTDTFGCQGAACLILKEHPTPLLTINGRDQFCAGNNTTISVDPSFSSYFWSDSSTTQSIKVSKEDTYSVTVTDSKGCTANSSIAITLAPGLNPVIAGDTIICPGRSNTLTLTDTFHQYFWSTGLNSADISVNKSGQYCVTVKDPYGCSGSACIQIKHSELEDLAIDGNFEICKGDTSRLFIPIKNVTYIWSTGDTTDLIKVTQQDKYKVTVEDVYGCIATDSVNVVVHNLPVINLAPEDTVIYCYDAASTYRAPDGFKLYEWSDNSMGQTIEVTEPGTYILTVTDIFGCTTTGEKTFKELDSIHVEIYQQDQCLFFNASGGNPNIDSYKWSNGEVTQTICNLTNGTVYCLTVTDIAGCTKSDCFTYQHIATHNTALDKISIYPNPTRDILYISNLPDIQESNIEIYNTTGARMERPYTFEQVGATTALRLYDHTDGVYYIKIIYKDSSTLRKFVIIH